MMFADGPHDTIKLTLRNCMYVVSPVGETDGQALDSDKLRPCYVFDGSQMPSKALREKAVKAACDAVRNYDDYDDRVKYVRDKFDAEEAGRWACFIQQENTKASIRFTFFNDNRLVLCVGDSRFVLWQATN